MSAIDAAQAYFDAWNARDGAAIVASLSEDATYQDPMTGGPIPPAALKGYAETLWGAFPDLTFDVASIGEMENGRIAAEWIMRGTNDGPFNGLPPSGRAIESTGCDFIETRDGKVASVVGYFDGGTVPRQLGLQVVVQPDEIGPFKFGTSNQIQTGKTDAPGAFSVTQLFARDEDAAAEVSERSREILVEMMAAPGFIGATTAKIGPRMVTLSAWTDPEAPAKFMSQGKHAEAMKPFYDGSLSDAGVTSVWSPARINSYWVRCESCGTMNDSTGSAGSCTNCNAALPDHPPYW